MTGRTTAERALSGRNETDTDDIDQIAARKKRLLGFLFLFSFILPSRLREETSSTRRRRASRKGAKFEEND